MTHLQSQYFTSCDPYVKLFAESVADGAWPSGHQATYSIIIQEISQEEVETTTSDANKVTREQSGQSHA